MSQIAIPPTDGERPFEITYMRLPPPLWPVDVISILTGLWWTFCLVGDPTLMARNPTYTALRGQPQLMWAGLALVIALSQVLVLSVPCLRRFVHAVVLVVVFWWAAMGILYLNASFFSLGGGVYLILSLGVALRLWRW